ncbi:MAG: response regulator, partial [Anaerolineae bacterium]|nr:response regulator [Anaerolineae bacterium]
MAKHILVVDDDALMRRSICFNLEQAGYRTSNIGTAEEALDLAKQDRPDLVLLDIGLPGIDGLEALRRFQQEIDNVPVIFVTARRRELDTILGLELGADAYITKPFNPDVLLAHVKSVLRRSAAAPADA